MKIIIGEKVHYICKCGSTVSCVRYPHIEKCTDCETVFDNTIKLEGDNVSVARAVYAVCKLYNNHLVEEYEKIDWSKQKRINNFKTEWTNNKVMKWKN